MAGFISEDIISEICSNNDIIDYVSKFVQLKKTGRDYIGLCPFHNEKTPSFHVSGEKQLFHCFGCGASGNLVQFVMRTENLDFVETIKLLADRAGIVIPENGENMSNETHERKKRILDMNKLSARFFYDTLKNPEKGTEAREYFNKRRLSGKIINIYGLGYADSDKTSLINFLKTKNYTEKQILEAGLAVEREGKIVDKFRNRVMFPIIDVRGNIIGFGGRTMLDVKEINGYKIPKYLNSSETAAFDKGRNLFSLNLAKNAKSDKLILCEGYMDVISVYQAGVHNIVATLGTAITENQAKLMLRYANEILICYDMDEAGQKAALRAIDIINSVNGKSRVIHLNGAKDPDEYITKNGADAFKAAVKNAVPSTEFKLSLIKGRYDTSTVDGKISYISDAADALQGINNAVEVDAYIKKLSEENDISAEAVYSEFKKRNAKNEYRRVPTKQEFRTVQQQTDGKAAETKRIPNKLLEAEKRLLALVSSSRKIYRMAKDKLSPDDFSTPVYRRIAKKLYELQESGQAFEESMILNEFSSSREEADEASAVFYNIEIYDADTAAAADLIYTIKLEKLNTEIASETDAAKLYELFKKQRELKDEKNTWEE